MSLEFRHPGEFGLKCVEFEELFREFELLGIRSSAMLVESKYSRCEYGRGTNFLSIIGFVTGNPLVRRLPLPGFINNTDEIKGTSKPKRK